MKIKPAPRYIYDYNPLVEVVCQVRFARILELQTTPPATFQSEFARSRYPNLQEENAASLQVVFGKGAGITEGPSEVQRAVIPTTHHFISSDGTKRVSVNAEFFAFTCTRYERWESFKEAFSEAFLAFLRVYPDLNINRVGLRYKDLIEREPIGLEGVSWAELVTPAVAGLFLDDLFESGQEDVAGGAVQQGSQALIRLADCAVLLQTASLLSNDVPPKEAFLIDADFFHEAPSLRVEGGGVDQILEVLHRNAGALFRHCIKDRLHDALGPRPI